MRRLAVAAVAVVISLVVAGCGSNRRAEVNKYLKQVAAVQQRLRPRIADANVAYAEFPKALTSAKARVKLAKAEQTIRTLRRRIAALDPPDDARRLHRLLLQLTDREVAFAHEVLALARYTPRFRQVVAAAAAAGAKLRAQVRSGATEELADGFAKYARALDGDAQRLRRLSPPPAIAPSHRAEAAALTRSAGLCRRIAAAIRANDGEETARLIAQLGEASSIPARKRAQVAARRAVVAYNARLRSLDRLAAGVERERQRLERELD